MSSLLSCQITVGATIILPWNIVGGYSTGASVGDLYTSICNGSVWTGWELPAKYKNFSVKASIGRSKTDSFDNVMLSVSVSEAVALFGRYQRFNLVEQSDNNNNSTLNVNDQSPSMQSKRSAFEVLMTSSRKTSLPEPYAEDTSIPNNKRLVFNKVIHMWRMLDWKYIKKTCLPHLIWKKVAWEPFFFLLGLIYQFLNVCPFDYTAVAVSGKVGYP